MQVCNLRGTLKNFNNRSFLGSLNVLSFSSCSTFTWSWQRVYSSYARYSLVMIHCHALSKNEFTSDNTWPVDNPIFIAVHIRIEFIITFLHMCSVISLWRYGISSIFIMFLVVITHSSVFAGLSHVHHMPRDKRQACPNENKTGGDSSE